MLNLKKRKGKGNGNGNGNEFLKRSISYLVVFCITCACMSIFTKMLSSPISGNIVAAAIGIGLFFLIQKAVFEKNWRTAVLITIIIVAFIVTLLVAKLFFGVILGIIIAFIISLLVAWIAGILLAPDDDNDNDADDTDDDDDDNSTGPANQVRGKTYDTALELDEAPTAYADGSGVELKRNRDSWKAYYHTVNNAWYRANIADPTKTYLLASGSRSLFFKYNDGTDKVVEIHFDGAIYTIQPATPPVPQPQPAPQPQPQPAPQPQPQQPQPGTALPQVGNLTLPSGTAVQAVSLDGGTTWVVANQTQQTQTTSTMPQIASLTLASGNVVQVVSVDGGTTWIVV